MYPEYGKMFIKKIDKYRNHDFRYIMTFMNDVSNHPGFQFFRIKDGESYKIVNGTSTIDGIFISKDIDIALNYILG